MAATSATCSSPAISGHTTHGLALLAPYLAEIEKGAMMKTGEPLVVNARAAAQTWDGRRLPGPWLTLRALDTAASMAATNAPARSSSAAPITSPVLRLICFARRTAA